MAKCPFYKIHLHRRLSDKPDVPFQHVPWCNHTNSPVSLLFALVVLGDPLALKCGGELKQCQIPIEELRPPEWLASALEDISD